MSDPVDVTYEDIMDNEIIDESYLPDIMHFPDSPVCAFEYDNVQEFLRNQSFNYEKHGDNGVRFPNDLMNGSFRNLEYAEEMLSGDHIVITWPDGEHMPMSQESALNAYNLVSEPGRTVHIYGSFDYPELPDDIVEHHMFAIVDEVEDSSRNISNLKSYLFSSFLNEKEMRENLPDELELPYTIRGSGDGKKGIRALKEFIEE